MNSRAPLRPWQALLVRVHIPLLLIGVLLGVAGVPLYVLLPYAALALGVAVYARCEDIRRT